MAPHIRCCISCRKQADKSEFWRIVRLFPGHQVRPGPGMGRAAYLCPQSSCLQAAEKKDRLSRALKAPVPPEIYQDLWQQLAKSG
jgi:uncharacterized protein